MKYFRTSFCAGLCLDTLETDLGKFADLVLVRTSIPWVRVILPSGVESDRKVDQSNVIVCESYAQDSCVTIWITE